MKKRLFKVFVVFLVAIVVFFIYGNWVVWQSGQKMKVDGVADLSEADAVIALGARVYSSSSISDTFKDRLDTAFDVYSAGKVKKILVSGDHGRKEYDEVNAGREYLLSKGVKEEDVFMDHAGFDTYDSFYRARDVFKVKSIVIPSQKINLPRALYLANGLGLSAQGLEADRHIYVNSRQQFFRERLANVKAVWNLFAGSKPKFLGLEINISGDGRLSWD